MSTERYPDWVMLGVPQANGGVAIYASRKLTKAALTTRIETVERLQPEYLPPAQAALTDLAAVMKDVVVAHGKDYTQALFTLLNVWTGDERPFDVQPRMVVKR